jgi:hypothetical protein
MDATDTHRMCEKCRAQSRERWRRKQAEKLQIKLPELGLRSSSPLNVHIRSSSLGPAQEEDISSDVAMAVNDGKTKQCNTCKNDMPAQIPYKLCDACRARGREANRRAAEKKRQMQLGEPGSTASAEAKAEDTDGDHAPTVRSIFVFYH